MVICAAFAPAGMAGASTLTPSGAPWMAISIGPSSEGARTAVTVAVAMAPGWMINESGDTVRESEEVPGEEGVPGVEGVPGADEDEPHAAAISRRARNRFQGALRLHMSSR